MQSNLNARASAALHVAVVMDGNGRWATRRGLPRTAGHRAGAEAVRRVVEAAPGLGIGVLTLFAFSADNWGRPRPEVTALMRLLRAYLRAETVRCVENGLRVSVISGACPPRPARRRPRHGVRARLPNGSRTSAGTAASSCRSPGRQAASSTRSSDG